nr:hypothetical protein [Staphylococcus haemolyticus]
MIESRVVGRLRFNHDFVIKIGRAVQQECRDRSRMPSSAGNKKREILFKVNTAAVAITIISGVSMSVEQTKIWSI